MNILTEDEMKDPGKGVSNFVALSVQSAMNRVHARMDTHPLNDDKIEPSLFYMLMLTEEEIERWRLKALEMERNAPK